MVFARWVAEGFWFGGVLVEFLDDTAEIAKACGDHTDAFFESVEGDATEAGSEG